MAQSHPSRNDSITSTIARIIFAEFLISSTVIRVFESLSAFVLGFRFGLDILLTSFQSLVRLSCTRLEKGMSGFEEPRLSIKSSRPPVKESQVCFFAGFGCFGRNRLTGEIIPEAEADDMILLKVGASAPQ